MSAGIDVQACVMEVMMMVMTMLRMMMVMVVLVMMLMGLGSRIILRLLLALLLLRENRHLRGLGEADIFYQLSRSVGCRDPFEV